MSKVSQILPAFLLAVIIGAVTSDECLSQTQTWGVADNPYVFRYCDPTTNTSDTVDCPAGRGYVKNETVVGCIPWDQWSNNCITEVDGSTIICDKNNSKQPISSYNPGWFYLCIKLGWPPVKESCEPGKGFLNKYGFLGCIPYVKWRHITGCVNTA